jgi:hypothetical protein
MTLARRWLAVTENETRIPDRPSFASWIDEYKLADREVRLRASDRSSLVGKTLADLNLRQAYGANVVALERNGGFSREISACCHFPWHWRGPAESIWQPMVCGR